jgi:acetyltransferase
MECFPSVSDIPVPADLAVIVTPARTVPAIVEECGQAGIEGVIIISAVSEGKTWQGLEDEIRKTEQIRCGLSDQTVLVLYLPHQSGCIISESKSKTKK